MVKVSVVVPTRGRVTHLRNLLKNLADQTCPPEEIIFATTPLDRDTVKFFNELGENFEGIRLIKIVENGGTSKLRNLGVARSSGDVVVFLDDDVVLERGYIGNLKKIFSKKDINVVTGYTFDLVDLTVPWLLKTGDLEYITTHDDEFVKILKEFLKKRGLNVDMIEKRKFIIWKILKLSRNTLKSIFLWESPLKGRILPSGYRSEFPEITKLKGMIEVEWVQGNNFSARKEVLMEFPFNEELERKSPYALNEDLEWSARVGLKYKIYLSPELRVIHLRAPGNRLRDEKRLEALIESTYRIARIRGNRFAHLWSSLGLLLTSLLRIPVDPSKGIKTSMAILRSLKGLYL